MNVPTWTKPAVWGVIGGAVGAIAIGFSWGGWVTSGTASEMAEAGAQSAIVQAFTPLCVAKAEAQPAKITELQAENSWGRDEFVVEAGWVSSVKEDYRDEVAKSCASAVIEAMAAASEPTPDAG